MLSFTLKLSDTILQTKETSPIELVERYLKFTNNSIFLTGKAGTGKTTFLHRIRHELLKNNIVVAPTGVAAINAKGTTIHSQFSLPLGTFIPDQKFDLTQNNFPVLSPANMHKHLKLNDTKRQLIRDLELIILDEVSMLRADLLDCLDFVLRFVRKKNEPFGGIQLLLIGDMMQLPPVVKEVEWDILRQYYESPFFFHSKALQNLKPIYIELTNIYRQQDDSFIALLNNLRTNQVTSQDIALLNKYVNTSLSAIEKSNTITLTTHNATADSKNDAALAALPGSAISFKADIEGEFAPNQYPIDLDLKVKQGARVMFVKNDISGEQKYFNGKIGTVTKTESDSILVRFDDGIVVDTERHVWENIKYEVDQNTGEIEAKVVGSFIQFPLRLAYAITVHKSQGLTFDKAILDLNRAFAPGQVYVALSRLRSLEGLILSEPIRIQSIPQSQTLKQHEESKLSVDILSTQLKSFTLFTTQTSIKSIYEFSSLIRETSKQLNFEESEEMSFKSIYAPWAQSLISDLNALQLIANKFQQQVEVLLSSQQTDLLNQRIHAASTYFVQHTLELGQKVLKQMFVALKEKRVKTYVKELMKLENDIYRKQTAIQKFDMTITELETGENQKSKFKNIDQLARIDEVKKIFEEMGRLEAMADINFIGRKKSTKKKKEKMKSLEDPIKVIDKNFNKSYEVKESSLDQTLNLIKEGKSIEEMVAIRDLKFATIFDHIVKLVHDKKISGHKYIDPTTYELIKVTRQQLNNEDKFSPIKQKLGDQVSFDEIRLAIAIQKCEE